MQPNTPPPDAPLDDELLPPSPFLGSIDMPTPTFAETIEGEGPNNVLKDLFDDEEPAKTGWLSRLSQTLFGR
jgi:hypothetical protein